VKAAPGRNGLHAQASHWRGLLGDLGRRTLEHSRHSANYFESDPSEARLTGHAANQRLGPEMGRSRIEDGSQRVLVAFGAAAVVVVLVSPRSGARGARELPTRCQALRAVVARLLGRTSSTSALWP
jgi:hypothetical protein